MLLKSASLAPNAIHVAANNKQILKRKSTTATLVTNEGPSDKHHKKKKKTSKFSAMPISEFLEKNNDHNEGENQLKEDEGDNQMEQLASQDSNQCETTLQSECQNSSKSAMNSYKSLFGKEKPGRVRCLGKTLTPTILKKNEEFAAIKKQHDSEIASQESKVGVMQNEMDGLKSIVKCLLGQSIPEWILMP
ncbi:hypothetical protein RJT34_02528 [Clitoria ternatea]|uniref:Uncharacterized protein n=1 Tax=Clitoria ternatea TaxID=43366 RepID=A0AAN9KIP5_CLITE